MIARSEFHESKTALIAMSICSRGSIGNSRAGLLLHDGLEPADDVLEVLGVQVEVELGALLALDLVEGVLEQLAVDVEDGLAEHLDQPAVGVPGEPLAARLLRPGPAPTRR